jgi:hypothetical protein
MQHITSAFTFSRVLGRGSFGVVVLAERRQAGAQQAGMRQHTLAYEALNRQASPNRPLIDP